MPSFSPISEQRLATCHESLQLVAREAIKIVDFVVLEGHRGEAAQNAAYHDGKSEKPWPESRHNSTPSLAIDVAPWPVDWRDRERFFLLAGVFFAIAHANGINIVWGGKWKMQDLPHFELRYTGGDS